MLAILLAVVLLDIPSNSSASNFGQSTGATLATYAQQNTKAAIEVEAAARATPGSSRGPTFMGSMTPPAIARSWRQRGRIGAVDTTSR